MKLFTIMNEQIRYTDSQTNFNEVRSKFIYLLNTYEDEYKKVYTEVKTLDEFLNQSDHFFQKYYRELTNLAISLFIENGIQGIDTTSFYQTCEEKECFQDWKDLYEEIQDKKLELEGGHLHNNEKRKQRRETRRRSTHLTTLSSILGKDLNSWAIGKFADYSINATSNIIHGSVNIIASGLEKKKINQSLSSYLQDSDTLSYLVQCFESSCLHVLHVFTDLCNKEKQCSFYRSPNEEEVDTTISIVNNIKDGFIDVQHIRKRIVEALRLNPYLFDIYRILLDEVTVSEQEVQLIADYFKIPIQIIKLEKLQKTYEEDLKTATTEADFKRLYEKYTDICHHSSIDKDNGILNDILERLNKIDEVQRTVEGIVFPTREEAGKARLEKERIIKIFTSTDTKSENSILEAEKIFQEGKIIEIEAWNKQVSKRFEKMKLKLTIQDKVSTGYNKLLSGIKKRRNK